MVSKEQFFASLTPTAIEPTAMPSLTLSADKAPLREVFTQVLASVGGQLGDGDKLQAVQQQAAQLVAQNRQVLSLVDGITGNRDPSAISHPHQLADIDYTITAARLAVAECGAVWICGDDLVSRSAVFICEHLIAIVDESRITGTMSDAIKQVGKLGGSWGVFISGPSKTADIEQALVMGAHGARSMTVYLIGQ